MARTLTARRRPKLEPLLLRSRYDFYARPAIAKLSMMVLRCEMGAASIVRFLGRMTA